MVSLKFDWWVCISFHVFYSWRGKGTDINLIVCIGVGFVIKVPKVEA